MNRILTALSYMILLAVVAGVIGGGYLLYRVIETTVAAVPSVAWLATGGAVLFAFVLVIVGGAVYIVKALAHRSRRIYAKDGLYPVIDHGRGAFSHLNEPGAQSLAVLAAGRRPTAALAGRVIDAQYRTTPEPAALPALPEPERLLTVDDVVSVNLRTDPHWLIVGSTGSGKTVASYAVLSAMAARWDCQFVICEPGGVNWGAQTTATTTAQIAQTILAMQRELERRQALLRAQDVDHVEDLPEPLPYLVLVGEELESVLDDLRLTDRDTRTAAIVALRAIARLGRKCGVVLVAVSQSSSVDVLDAPTRRNLSNVLLFRSQHTVGETWRVSRDVKLAELPTGAAWSVRHNAVVSFPRMARPNLPTADMGDVPELPEPVLVDDGIAVQNWPTFTAVLDGSGGSRTVLDGSGPVLAVNQEPDPVLADTMRSWYASGVSKNEICRRVWPAKNGITWAMLSSILEEVTT